MKILYVGDVMGEAGLGVVERVLPNLRLERQIDLVVAQAENVTEGKGVSLDDFARLKKAGVDFCTGGNWSLHRSEIIPSLSDPAQPIIRPANYPADTPGLGWKYTSTRVGKVLVISLLGQIVGKDAEKPVDNPLHVVDEILESQKGVERVATVVNFHGDFSSEKVVIGHYLDGRVSMVIGDHWHVPTADARVLPGGTAHQTDVGMCGTLDSSLGVEYDSIIPRWKTGHPTRNILAHDQPYQFNGLLVKVNEMALADSVEQIQLTLQS
ncbi:TIGR00282 family metallophosphoesterase [soil metagenome]